MFASPTTISTPASTISCVGAGVDEPEQADGEMTGVGGRADLVVDDDHRAAALPEPEHRLHEVAAVRAKEPGGAHDEALPVHQSRGALTAELGAPVGVDRIGVV